MDVDRSGPLGGPRRRWAGLGRRCMPVGAVLGLVLALTVGLAGRPRQAHAQTPSPAQARGGTDGRRWLEAQLLQTLDQWLREPQGPVQSWGLDGQAVGATHQSALALGQPGSWTLTWWVTAPLSGPTSGAGNTGGAPFGLALWRWPRPAATPPSGAPEAASTGGPAVAAPWPWEARLRPLQRTGEPDAVVQLVAVRWDEGGGTAPTQVLWFGAEGGACAGQLRRERGRELIEQIWLAPHDDGLQRARWVVDPTAPLRLGVPEPQALLRSFQQGGWTSWEDALALGPAPCSTPWVGPHPQTWPAVQGTVGGFHATLWRTDAPWRGPWIQITTLQGPVERWSPQPGLVLTRLDPPARP